MAMYYIQHSKQAPGVFLVSWIGWKGQGKARQDNQGRIG